MLVKAMRGLLIQEYEKQGKDCRYFLKNVKSVFEKDDLTIANLEGPLTTSQDYAEKTLLLKENQNMLYFNMREVWKLLL